MATTTWKRRASLIQGIGLLVLVGMVCLTGTAWAQFECQLPAGVTPPSEPRVTAQEVEDGTASLADFALAVRDQNLREIQEITTEAQAAYNGCLARQEGSPLRSGSTYTVQLTPDGRVFVHTKDMSLSGRLLNPVIYGAILQALGIDPSALARPGAAAAFFAAAGGDGGLFEVPGFPGASGYAFLAETIGGQIPLVKLVGFDLVESHVVPVAEDDIDYGAPEVEAEDVVDRASLKAFVIAAEDHILQLLETGDLAAASKAKVAFRDPEGPWRRGPVYLAVSERASRFIIFHGAFPDRFELRHGGIARDVATGELVSDQLFDAAESGPDGGFWLYHFDDPSDDTDSEDTPKVGYARILSYTFQLPDGTMVPTDYVINSGFYLTSDSVFVQRLLAALTDGQESIMFGVTAPDEGDAVSGDAVAVSVEGAPTDTVHFAYRLAGAEDEPFTYAGAATNRGAMASFSWDTLGLADDDYEFAALYTEDDGFSVTYDSVEVTVDNVDDGGGGGGCALAPVLAGGGPLDPTLPALVGLALAWLTLARRRLVRHAALA